LVRDVSHRCSRARRKSVVTPKRRRRVSVRRVTALSLPGIGLTCCIMVVGLNLAVLLYHGDPRVHFVQAAQAADLVVDAKESSRNRVESIAKGESEDEVLSEKIVHISEPARLRADQEWGPEVIVSPPNTLATSYGILNGVRTSTGYDSVSTVVLKSGQTPAGALYDAGLAGADVRAILASLKPFVDFRRLRPGNYFSLFFDETNELQSVELYRGILEQTLATRTVNGWNTEPVEVPVEIHSIGVGGTIRSSLWGALKEEGEAAELVNAFVDVFAWDIDFYSEVFPGDTFKVLVDKKYAGNRLIGYANVEAAQFVSRGKVHRAYLHREKDGTVGYYDKRGHSMQKQLLKSPLKYGHVTSRFGKRRHPVLGYTRNHNGIDYGVGVGTPTWSVGGGRVVRAGYHGGFGNLVEVRHANGWLSQYAHLSRISVRVGERVTQKQIIGKTGNTGMSSGPHLHYGLKRHGTYVNPLTQKFSRGKSLRGSELKRFEAALAELDTRLEMAGSFSDS